MALSTAASCPVDQVPSRAADLLARYRGVVRELGVAADLAVNEAIETAWAHGWQPCDLHEFARRTVRPAAVRHLDEAIVRESQRYAAASVHPQWRADLAGLAATVEANPASPPLWRWAASNGVGQREALALVVTLLNFLGTLPVLEVLVPPPGSYRPTATAAGDAGEKALSRVRALLAKAEATEYPDEAEALSAKAQDLMSRYSLKRALAQHDLGHRPTAAARRIWIESPYATAKVALVETVSRCNRCHAVWAQRLGVVTVIGCETDLHLVELLTTSLLVQANRAMLSAGRHGGRPARSKSFRHAFLVAYAQRIGERLEGASVSALAEAQRSGRLLPVLRANNQAAEELADRLFPSTVARSVAVSNGAGWGAGRAAADLAVLDTREAIAG